jgi:RNA polymerase sigma-70 factor, ECF subfamily
MIEAIPSLSGLLYRASFTSTPVGTLVPLMPSNQTITVLGAVERCRQRIWAHCYRMTGRRAEADDLSQEAIARAIERADSLDQPQSVEGWLFRIATTVCLDHLRRLKRVQGLTELVDPMVLADMDDDRSASGEDAVLRREDVRFAVIAALQHLPPRQRAVLLLHEVCGLSLVEVADAVGSNESAVKGTLHRARAGLERSRGRLDVDPNVDRELVERLARAFEARSVEALAELLLDDVWGVVDGGRAVKAARRPTVGARALLQRFVNLTSRLGSVRVACRVVVLNGEPAVLTTLPDLAGAVFSSVHIETREGRIAAMRVVRDPDKLAHLAQLKS